MYVKHYNRMIGWISAAFGFIGLFGGKGDYIQMSPAEWAICFVLGWLGMSGARVKSKKNQAAICATVTFLYISWTLTASNPAFAIVSAATPLEWIVRFLAALWGVYCCGQEIWHWRHRLSHL